jgi:SIR2-like domain
MAMAPDPIVALASSLPAAPGTFALLLGSGISRAAQVPTGWDVVVALAKRVAVLESAEEPLDPLAWYSERFGGQPDYSALLAQLAPTPAERRNLLEGFFEPTAEEREQGIKTPTRAHRAIAELAARGYVRVIVTTNFDRLLEVALIEAGVQPVVITGEHAAAGAIPLAHSRCTLIKVHGDYLDPDLKNTAEELGTYTPGIDALLDQVFDQYGLIVCGWSADWDEALRNALLRAPSRRYGTYWTRVGSPGSWAQRLITHRQAIEMTIAGADEFFESLTAKVTALAEAMDQRPLSTALAAAELKRYLPEPRYRIRLHDLFMDEVGRIVGQPRAPTDQPPPTTETLTQRLLADEAAVATLLALLVHAGYFADRSEHDDLLVNVLRRLASRPATHSGIPLWINV